MLLNSIPSVVSLRLLTVISATANKRIFLDNILIYNYDYFNNFSTISTERPPNGMSLE